MSALITEPLFMDKTRHTTAVCILTVYHSSLYKLCIHVPSLADAATISQLLISNKSNNPHFMNGKTCQHNHRFRCWVCNCKHPSACPEHCSSKAVWLQGSLAVATQMLMSEEAYAVPGLRAALGRVANSVVAVLGPELSPGTDVYSKCKALIKEVQVRHVPCLMLWNAQLLCCIMETQV